MKYPKAIGPALLATVAVAVLFAAPSAGATVLCKNTTTTPCSAKYPAKTTLSFALQTGTSLVFEENLVEGEGLTLDKCTSSAIASSTENEGGAGEAVKAKVETKGWTWAGCSRNTITEAGGQFEIQWIPGSNHGTVIANKFKIRVETFLYGVCIFLFEGADFGTLTEGMPAQLDVNAAVTEDVNKNCPPTRMTATFLATAPTTTLAVAEK